MKRKKTGGRKKGVPNKASAAKAKEVAESGLTPLDYMLQVMRDDKADPLRRDGAAKDAAPYVHPRLQPVDKKTGSAAMVVKMEASDDGL